MTKIKMIFNKYEIVVTTKKDLLTCLQFLLESLDKYSPKEVFLENIGKAMDTVYELADSLQEELMEHKREHKKLIGEITALKKKVTILKNSFRYIKTKEAAIGLQYNIMLSFEDLGLLNGFGAVTKFGDKIDYFNPERNTIVNTDGG